MNTNLTPRCNRCGSTAVRWSENADGMYLVDVATWTGSRTGARRSYPRGPHKPTCDRFMAENRRNERFELATRIISRYAQTVVVPLAVAGKHTAAAEAMEKGAAWRDAFLER